MGYILHALTAVLVVLKLTDVITASWLVVIAPSLISLALGILIAVVGVFIVYKATK